MREGIAAFFMAVAAQGGYRICLGRLRVRVVACLALHACLGVFAGTPLIGGVLVAGRAQLRIGRDRHELAGMVGLEGTVAGFAADAFLRVRSGLGIEAGGVACQTIGLLSQLSPIALENGRRECLRMACVLPCVNNPLMALFAGV